ncbi:MAG: nitrous oxide-stimulated promoter family protein [Chloroflexi bacterium]|nr:nitrous oxide-stimulated promoter family protein [Chloroflexota bacterium]
MDESHPRIARESKTIAVMIDLYCRSKHGSDKPCADCNELLIYAKERLEKCPFQEGKTTCAKCPVHCFKPDMREKIRAVMRHSGPRMFYRHPLMATLHLVDRSRKEPVRQHKKGTDGTSQ